MEIGSWNPVLFLQRIGYEKLEEITKDKQIMRNIQDVYDKFEKYLQVEKRKDVPSISYFSMEYGLSHVLKIYSGGLGVLAGDYLKRLLTAMWICVLSVSLYR